jgi:hypothetical protein
MIEHTCMHFCALYESLGTEIDKLSTEEPQSIINSKDKKRLDHRLMEPLEHEFIKLNFVETANHIYGELVGIRDRLEHGSDLNAATLLEKMRALQRLIVQKMMELKFAYIPSPNDKYFEQQYLFGEKVDLRLEEARQEIKDSGNCFAAELYTACVFHLIRILEHGLRSIANATNVVITDKKQVIPLEYGDWNKVLDAIDGKITAARALPNNAAKGDLIKRYSEASDRLMWARDQWRNDIAHTRTRFSLDGAKDVFERTKSLMQFLAETLDKPW